MVPLPLHSHSLRSLRACAALTVCAAALSAQWNPSAAYSPGITNTVNVLVGNRVNNLFAVVAVGPGTGGLTGWNGVSWSPVPGLSGTTWVIRLPNGELLAGCGGGVFLSAGGTGGMPGTFSQLFGYPSSNALFTGTAGVRALAADTSTLPPTVIVAGGDTGLALLSPGPLRPPLTIKFPTSGFFQMLNVPGLSIGVETVRAIAEIPLLGASTFAVGGLYYFAPVGAPLPLVQTNLGILAPSGAGFAVGPFPVTPPGGRVDVIRLLRNGNLVTAHNSPTFPYTSTLESFNFATSTWTNLGASPNGIIKDVLELPDGQLLVSGDFQTIGVAPSFVAAPLVARFNGTTWLEVPTPGGTSGAQGIVNTMTLLEPTEIAVGGVFNSIPGYPAPPPNVHVTALMAGFAPSVIDLGVPGCIGTGGQNMLANTNFPWLGGTFAATATGMAPGSIAVSIVGFNTTAVQLGPPLSGPPCWLLANPDITTLVIPVGGVANTSFAIPLDPLWVGSSLFHQVACFDPGLGGAITTTNALRLVLGFFL